MVSDIKPIVLRNSVAQPTDMRLRWRMGSEARGLVLISAVLTAFGLAVLYQTALAWGAAFVVFQGGGRRPQAGEHLLRFLVPYRRIVLLDRLGEGDVRVMVDLTEVGEGTYQFAPKVILAISELRVESILPSSIEVVVEPKVQGTQTPTLFPEPPTGITPTRTPTP